MMSAFILSQVLAGFAFAFGLSAYQFKDRKILLLLLAAAQISNSIHFFLLGAVAGGVIVAISALRYLVGVWSSHPIARYIFVIAVVASGAYVFENNYDLLPIIGGILGTMAAFTAAKKRMRQYLLGGTVAILLYNMLIFSPVAILAGSFFFASAVFGYWRFHVRAKESGT